MISIRAAISAVCLGVLVLSSQGAFAQQRKLTYATFYSTNEFYEISAKHFMEEITKRTNGRITFEPYYSGTLLKPAEISQGLSRGVADVAVGVPAAFNPREFPLSGVVLPFITENPMAATRAFMELYGATPALQQEFQRNNQRLLWVLASGENSLWTNKPIRSLEDLRGARIRSVLGVADVLRELGATPVGVPWVEALELMQRGGVEGVSATPFNQAAVAGTLDMASYASNGGRMGVYAIVTWSMNLDTWKSLDAETQKIVSEVAAGASQYYFERYDEDVNKAVAAVRASNVKYVHLDDGEVNRWTERGRPFLHGRWVDATRNPAIDPRRLLEDYTALVKKYEQSAPYVTGLDRLRQSP